VDHASVRDGRLRRSCRSTEVTASMRRDYRPARQ
jgi:hypothetical protein